jgi:hypothetical protein
MSIIEEALRKLQDKQQTTVPGPDIFETPVVDRNVSMNIKPAFHRTFAGITSILIILGLITYIGLNMYDGKQKEVKKNIYLNHDLLLGRGSLIPVDFGTNPKRGLNMENHLNIGNQPIRNMAPPQQADTSKDPDETQISLLVKEYEIQKQLDYAKRLISVGSYIDAIKDLDNVLGRSVRTWEAYLLMGTAYLGLGELDSAEIYMGIGLAINEKQPQWWIQRVMLKLQRGENEAALQILHGSERLAPILSHKVR